MKAKTLTSLLLIQTFCLMSCNNFVSLVTPINRTQTYQVTGGQQAFSPLLYEHFSGLTHVSFKINFNANTIYKSPLANEIPTSSVTQVNKLIGFTDCGSLISGPYHNDAFFGWAYFNQQMRIYPFINGPQYANGFNYGAFDNPLAIITPGKDYRYAVDLVGNSYQFTVQDLTTQKIIGSRLVPRTQCSTPLGGQLLSPFFGGSEAAPQNMSIEITIE